jgi:hypothetical protein
MGSVWINLLNNKISVSIIDGASGTAFLSFDKTQVFCVTIEYSIAKSGFSQIGTLQAISDGTNVNIADVNIKIGLPLVVFSATITGGSFNIEYTSTTTGANGTLKYSSRVW